jgi:hypothetical protein
MDWNSEQAEKAEGDGKQEAERGSDLQQAVRHTPQRRFILFNARPLTRFSPLCIPFGEGTKLS